MDWLYACFLVYFSAGGAPEAQNGNANTVSKSDVDLKVKPVGTNGLPVIGNAFSLSAAMMEGTSNIVLTTRPLEDSGSAGQHVEAAPPLPTAPSPPVSTVSPLLAESNNKRTVGKLPTIGNASSLNATLIKGPSGIVLMKKPLPIAAPSPPYTFSRLPTAASTKIKSTNQRIVVSTTKANEPGKLPTLGNTFNLNSAVKNKVTNRTVSVELPIAPLKRSAVERRPIETNSPPLLDAIVTDGDIDSETYEILDVVDTESDAGPDPRPVSNSREASPVSATNDGEPLPKISKVFQAVTSNIFDDLVKTRKQKILETRASNNTCSRKVAKKSTSPGSARPEAQKYRMIMKSHFSRLLAKNGSDRVSNPLEAGDTCKASESDTSPMPSSTEEDLIEVIEVPENMLVDGEEERTDAVDAGNSPNEAASADESDDDAERSVHYTDYRCNLCMHQNKNFVDLKMHLAQVHQLPAVCWHCHGAFESDQALQVHMEINDCHDKLNTYREYITVIPPPIRESEIVVGVDPDDESFFCGHCSRKCDDIMQYCGHAQHHAKEFTCKICSKIEFRSAHEMLEHLESGNHCIDDVQRKRILIDPNGLYMSTMVAKPGSKYVKRRVVINYDLP